MKCKYCDSIIPDNADSCPNCGAQVIHKDEYKDEKAHTDKNKAGIFCDPDFGGGFQRRIFIDFQDVQQRSGETIPPVGI